MSEKFYKFISLASVFFSPLQATQFSPLACGARSIRLDFSYKHPQPLKGARTFATYGEASPHKITPCAPYARSKNWLLEFIQFSKYSLQNSSEGIPILVVPKKV